MLTVCYLTTSAACLPCESTVAQLTSYVLSSPIDYEPRCSCTRLATYPIFHLHNAQSIAELPAICGIPPRPVAICDSPSFAICNLIYNYSNCNSERPSLLLPSVIMPFKIYAQSTTSTDTLQFPFMWTYPLLAEHKHYLVSASTSRCISRIIHTTPKASIEGGASAVCILRASTKKKPLIIWLSIYRCFATKSNFLASLIRHSRHVYLDD